MVPDTEESISCDSEEKWPCSFGSGLAGEFWCKGFATAFVSSTARGTENT